MPMDTCRAQGGLSPILIFKSCNNSNLSGRDSSSHTSFLPARPKDFHESHTDNCAERILLELSWISLVGPPPAYPFTVSYFFIAVGLFKRKLKLFSPCYQFEKLVQCYLHILEFHFFLLMRQTGRTFIEMKRNVTYIKKGVHFFVA